MFHYLFPIGALPLNPYALTVGAFALIADGMLGCIAFAAFLGTGFMGKQHEVVAAFAASSVFIVALLGAAVAPLYPYLIPSSSSAPGLTIFDTTPNRDALVGMVAIGLIAVYSYLIVVLRRLSEPTVNAKRQIATFQPSMHLDNSAITVRSEFMASANVTASKSSNGDGCAGRRIVIVGGVAAGASAAAKARRTSETAEIVLFESGPYMSYANCGLPYYVGGEISSRDGLFVTEPAQFAQRFLIDVRLDTRVLDIDAAQRRVSFARANSAREEILSYDRLILATGTVPTVPPVAGLDGPNIFLCRTVPDVDAITKRLEYMLERNALVIGGGYIGIECAEQLLRRGFSVTVVEMQDQIMGPLDNEIARPVQLAMEAAGATVILNDGVARLDVVGARSNAVLRSAREFLFDIAIVATGVRPNVDLAMKAGLTLGATGAIAVDVHQRTSDPAIFAAGDNCEAIFLPTGLPVNIPLAGPANKQGRIAGQNAALDLADSDIHDTCRLSMRGVLGTAIVRFREVVAGATGLSEKQAKRANIDTAIAYATGPNHADYFPGAEQMLLKLLFEPNSGKLLGAQVVGGAGVDKRIDILATALQCGLTVEDLEQLDLCYAPPFGSAKDVVNMAGFIASNAYRGTSPGVSPVVLAEEMSWDEPPFLLDVRSANEYDSGRLIGSVNIPLDQLRQRITEVPLDGPVIVHCGTGFRSYIAQQILLNDGWTNVRNLYGGYRLARQIVGNPLIHEAVQ